MLLLSEWLQARQLAWSRVMWGVGPESVCGWLREIGVEPPGRRASRLRDPSVREAVRLVRAGMSINQAAQTVGLSTGVLHSRLKKAGVIEVRPRRARLSPESVSSCLCVGLGL